jgi:hypothetical protein
MGSTFGPHVTNERIGAVEEQTLKILKDWVAVLVEEPVHRVYYISSVVFNAEFAVMAQALVMGCGLSASVVPMFDELLVECFEKSLPEDKNDTV